MTKIEIEEKETEKKNVTILRQTYHKDDFRVYQVKDDNGEKFTIAGEMPEFTYGDEVCAYGTLETYRGRLSFRVSFAETRLPDDPLGIKEYLSKRNVAGIGPQLAERIVSRFGNETFRIMDETPELLLDINGIGVKKLEMIKTSWEKTRANRMIAAYLVSIGISAGYASAVRKTLGTVAIPKIRENPYSLCNVRGIGFLTADRAAMKMGIGADSPFRIREGMKYLLGEYCEHANTCMEKQDLMRQTSRLLNVSMDMAEHEYRELLVLKDIVSDKGEVYLPYLYEAECRVARMLVDLKNTETPKECENMSAGFIGDLLGNDYEYDELQAQAIETAASENVLIITGGPGTGKSTILEGIITLFKESGLTFTLAAPTGRAAKRMTETTGEDAMTIHRLLGFDGTGYCDDPIETNAVIIDEMSMVDICLMDELLQHMPPGTRLIMIGDVDQLPSVGPGTVLKDLLDSGVIPTVRLEKTFRQAQESYIIRLAQGINKGYVGFRPRKDAFWVEREGAETIAEKIVSLVAREIPEKMGFKTDDIQVLAPMRKYACGVEELNTSLRDVLNPSKDDDRARGFAVGDHVMNLRNNYDKEIFNGDMGVVTAINREDQVIKVDFDGMKVDLDYDEADDLTLSYATTIHKSQGNEYPVVVMPVCTSHWAMLQRTLAYTGVTRAKKLLILVGERRALAQAIRNNDKKKRHGHLLERVLEYAS